MHRAWNGVMLPLSLAVPLLAGCAAPGDSGPPSWRRESPAAMDPKDRWVDPDDGFQDYMAGGPARTRPAPTAPAYDASGYDIASL